MTDGDQEKLVAEAEEMLRDVSPQDLVSAMNLVKQLLDEDRSRLRVKLMEAERFSPSPTVDRTKAALQSRDSAVRVASGLHKLFSCNKLNLKEFVCPR